MEMTVMAQRRNDSFPRHRRIGCEPSEPRRCQHDVAGDYLERICRTTVFAITRENRVPNQPGPGNLLMTIIPTPTSGTARSYLKTCRTTSPTEHPDLR